MDFKVQYPNGYLTVDVNNFFAKSDISNIKKLFKLAKQHCGESDHVNLLENLKKSKEYWNNLQENYSRLNLWETREWYPSTKSQLAKLSTKLDNVISYLKKECWNETV